jgi:hypothetical protein
LQQIGFEQVSGIPLPWSFCYQLEAGIGWQITAKIFISTSLGYFHSSPNRKYTAYSFTTFPPTGSGKSYDTHYPISSLNILAGVGYRF